MQQPSELCYPIIMVSSKLAAKFKASLQPLPPASAPVVAEGTAQAAPAAVPSRGEGSPAPGGVGAGGRLPDSPSKSGALRPDVLRGMKSVNAWLSEEAAAVLASQVSPKTVEQYERNGARLHAARALGEPVDLSKHTGSASTFYAYRAAVRWYAATHGAQAVRDYDNAQRRASRSASPARKSATRKASRGASLPCVMTAPTSTRICCLLHRKRGSRSRCPKG